MESELDKKACVNRLLEAIWGISDIKYQRRVWYKGIGPEVDDINETTVEISDMEEIIFPEHKEFGLSDEHIKVLREFMDHLYPYADEHETDFASGFIYSPEWKEIAEHAQKVLDYFGYKKEFSFKYQLTVVRAYIYFFLRKFRKYTPLDTYKGRKRKVNYLNRIAVITYKDLIYSLADIDDFETFICRLTWTYRELLETPIFYEITEKQKVLLNAFGKRARGLRESFSEKKTLDYYRNSNEWKETEALAEVVIEAFEYKPRRLKPPPGVYDYEKKLSPLELFLLNVEKVANKRYQKRVWIREVGPEWDTYYQTAKKLLKLNDPTLLNSTLSEKQKEATENFYDLFERFHWDSSYYPEWFIDHINWKKLITLAKDVIKAFNYKKRRGPIYWTRVFFSYIRYFLGKFKNLKLTPSPPPYR